MLNNVSIRTLRAFIELAECRSFSRAADRTHLSKSAFSKLIARLESEVGTRLFNRDTRSVELTSEGQSLFEHARLLLRELDSAISGLRDQVELRRGRVSVATLPSLAADFLPQVFAVYRARHPGVSLYLYDRLADECFGLVRDRRVDFALSAPGPSLAEFDTRTILDERFCLVCQRTHPLARKRKVSLADLSGETLVNMVRTSSVRQHLNQVVKGGAIAESTLEVEHLATLAGLIANGLGIGLVPELTLFQFRRPELVAVPADIPHLNRPLLVVKRKGIPLSPAAEAMLQLAEKMMGPGITRPLARPAKPARRARSAIAVTQK